MLETCILCLAPFTRLPLCHVTNCANCLVATVERSAAASGQTFNIIDGDDIRVWRYLREYTRHTGRRSLLIPVPYFVGHGIAQMALLTSRALFGNKGKLPSLFNPKSLRGAIQANTLQQSQIERSISMRTSALDFEQCLKSTYAL